MATRQLVVGAGAMTGAAGPKDGMDCKDAVYLHGDGLNLSPGEYAECLSQLAVNGKTATDYYSQGGSVAVLEQQTAEHLGKECALFLPSGTLANQLAVRELAGPYGRILVQEQSHLHNDAGDCLPTLSNLQVIGMAPGESTFSLEQVQAEVERAAQGKVATRVAAISIESPVRRLSGRVFDFSEMLKISAFARQQGIALHLDGARVFLAQPYTGVSPQEYAALFDTVYVSLWKYFNAGTGGILAGSRGQIENLFHVRRMFGGSLAQGWMHAAVASHYLEGFSERFAEAAQRSNEVFRLLANDDQMEVIPIIGGTNITLLKVQGVDPTAFGQRLEENAIYVSDPIFSAPTDGSSVTFKLQVNESWLRRPPTELAKTIIAACDG